MRRAGADARGRVLPALLRAGTARKRGQRRDELKWCERLLVDPPLEKLGVDDYYRWSLEQAALIRAGRFSEVDIINVAEEIEDVGRSELRAFRSNLEAILVHMLKWNYQAERRTRSWELSIFEHRRRFEETLLDSASMAAKWDEVLPQSYRLARLRAARETNMPLRSFPQDCPYDRAEILEADYLLDERPI